MKRTIRTLALAAPLATVALSLGATPAQALSEPFEPDGPVITAPDLQPDLDEKAPPPPGDPEPDPDPEPEPDGPEVLDDEITAPDPCPTHGPCGDDPDDEVEKEPGDEPGDDDSSDDFEKPTRIDAGIGSGGSAGSEGGMELTWLLAGGALVTASGAAFAARSRIRTEA